MFTGIVAWSVTRKKEIGCLKQLLPWQNKHLSKAKGMLLMQYVVIPYAYSEIISMLFLENFRLLLETFEADLSFLNLHKSEMEIWLNWGIILWKSCSMKRWKGLLNYYNLVVQNLLQAESSFDKKSVSRNKNFS